MLFTPSRRWLMRCRMMLGNTEQFDSFLLYFKRTWIEGKRTARKIGNAKFPPRTWNALRRTQADIKRTNNCAEGFHSGLTQLIGCTNPAIWAFLRALKLQQSITDRKMTAERCVPGRLRRMPDWPTLRAISTTSLCWSILIC